MDPLYNTQYIFLVI